MSTAKYQHNTGYLKKILIMFLAAFLVLATCNNIYADTTSTPPPGNTRNDTANDKLGFAEKACDIYRDFSPILSFIILIVVITTAIAALFGKLSMAVVVTVMITAIVMKQAPQIVNIVTNDKAGSCVEKK